VLSDKDFDDLRNGMRELEQRLRDLLRPFLQDDDEQGDGPMAV